MSDAEVVRPREHEEGLAVAREGDVLDPMQERVSAAMRLARTVAPEADPRFLQTVQAVLDAVDQQERKAAAARPDARTTTPAPSGRVRAAHRMGVAPTVDAAATGIPRDSVYSDPVFLANSAWLLKNRRRIVGGVPVKDYRDCVAVGRSEDEWCCTGTLIDPKVVVTAGHCEDGGCGAFVFVGENVEKPDEGRILRVADRRTHSDYRPPREQDDIAVLVLEESIEDVAPRVVAPASALHDARSVRVVGYGHTDPDGSTGYGVRRLVDVPLATSDPRFGADPETEFVAGAPFLDRDSCSGDSGGPAYVYQGGAWKLAGATSRATASSVRTCGDGGVYTLVASYEEWLAPFLDSSGSAASDRRRRRGRARR